MERAHEGLLAACIGTMLIACGGGQTGDEDAAPARPWVGSPFAGAQDNRCPLSETPQPLSLDETSPSGFSAREVLDLASGDFEEELRWHEMPDPFAERLAFDGGSDAERISIQVRHDGGAVRYFAGQAPCSGRLEIDVAVTLRSDSGALDEQVPAILATTHLREVTLELRFRREEPALGLPVVTDAPVLPVHLLQSGPGVTIAGDDDTQLEFLAVHLSISELGLAGRVDLWVGNVERLTLFRSAGTIGPLCPHGYGFTLGSDDPLPGAAEGLSARDVLDLVQGAAVEATADDGSPVALSLDYAYVDGSACAQLGNTPPRLTLDATLRVSAETMDARIDGSWPVTLSTVLMETAGGPALERVRVELADGASPEVDTLEPEWGVTGLDLSSYDTVYIVLELEIDAGAAAPRVTGQLDIRAILRPTDRPVASGDGDALLRLRL
ncbi:MAG: hypothetical protein OXT09_00830 [Myxococcales bacterium]|nr:hypothetical protein [Myxococcales bacterium]